MSLFIMRNFIFLFLCLLLFSCTPKTKVTAEQTAQYEYCKKTLVDNKAAFIALGKTESKRDSLKDYIADVEQNNLDQLLEKYEVEEEQVVLFLFSICEKADKVDNGPTILETMQSADSLIKALDSLILEDSLKNLKSR